MDRYAFLRAVLPSSGNGNYVAFFAKDSIRKWNRHCDTIEQLADACVAASEEGLTAYYALGTFTDNLEQQPDGRVKVQRQAAKASKFKTLAIDIDAGKSGDTPCYDTKETALKELIRFVKDSGMPVPMVVSSGHGLHAYWPLAKEVDSATWREASVLLKGLCVKHKLVIDPSKVHDPSMVLRPLDTMNKNQLVSVIVPGAAARELVDLRGRLEQGAGLTKVAPMKVTTQMSVNEAALASFAEDYDSIDPDKVVQHCLQIRKATEDGGKDAGYWQWFMALGVASKTENPEATAKIWSSGHPDYDEATVATKMGEWKTLGVPTCSGFDGKVPGICSKCPHWGKINSPYRLGIAEPEPLPDPSPVQRDITPVPPPLSAPVPPPVVAPTFDFGIDPLNCTPSIAAPAPFIRTVEGVAVRREGVVEVFCPYDIFPLHLVRDPADGAVAIEWAWKKPHVGYTRMVIKAAYIFNEGSPGDLVTTLSNNGVLIGSKVHQIIMGAYLRAYTQQLQKQQATVDLYDTFGWKDDHTKFVLGSTEFRREENGGITSHEVGVSKLIAAKKYDATFSAKGNLAEWSEWTRVLDHPSLALHQIELARGFMSPLMEFTGLRGVVFSLAGTSGLGKSTAQRWAASIYGMPDRVNTTAQDTQMSIVQRMGIWNCIPLGIDETTLIKPEHLANLIYWGSQGQDRNRANETTQANTWCMAVSLSANRSMVDKTMVFGADVDALLMRIIELNFQSNPVFDEESGYGRRINMMLAENYGIAGRVYIPYLLSLGEARIKADIEAHFAYIRDTYGITFAGKERYWQTAVVLCDLASKYASQVGLIKYDYTKGTRALISQMQQNRTIITGAKRDSYDMVSDYLTEFNYAAVSILYRDGKGQVIDPLPRGEVRIRKELYASSPPPAKPDRGFFFIDKSHFHHWLVGKGFDFKTVMDDLTNDQAGFKPNKSGRIYMGKNTPITLPSVQAIGLNMSHLRFKGVLDQSSSHIELAVDNTKTGG